MTVRPLILAAALAASVASANAAEIRSGSGGSIDLGTLAGVAYYTPDAKGYHVVVTLAPRGAAPALRLETTLAAEQSVTLSTPRMQDEPATAVEIARRGEQVFVSKSGAVELRQEADATH
ncbi:hypothetical protein [Methylobacterium sp. J-076]|uniref:hypothetical protein n=1 Tax=Methylobacterium sp. J-076 TaxID=2836655 RepID=UPI001FB8AFBF|nr:hypothetical protein [Methylobacterium sp. J-076]MCJ2014611.1 hypothetical protein [Methylobacterium sp. J-076]